MPSDTPAYDPAADGWTMPRVGRFLQMVGPVWTRGQGLDLRLGLLVQDHHSNARGNMHGGMIMTLADYALGRIASEITGSKEQVTLQLDVQFVSAAKSGEFLIVSGELVRRTSHVLFVRGMLHAGDRAVASANGIWKAIRPS